MPDIPRQIDIADATPRPWRWERNAKLEIKAESGEWSSMIAHVYRSGVCNTNRYSMPAEANAELIVRAVNAYASVERLREALSGLLHRPNKFFCYHTNTEEGDYVECRSCHGVSPNLDVRSASITHAADCEYIVARAALADTDSQGEGNR